MKRRRGRPMSISLLDSLVILLIRFLTDIRLPFRRLNWMNLSAVLVLRLTLLLSRRDRLAPVGIVFASYA